MAHRQWRLYIQKHLGLLGFSWHPCDSQSRGGCNKAVSTTLEALSSVPGIWKSCLGQLWQDGVSFITHIASLMWKCINCLVPFGTKQLWYSWVLALILNLLVVIGVHHLASVRTEGFPSLGKCKRNPLDLFQCPHFPLHELRLYTSIFLVRNCNKLFCPVMGVQVWVYILSKYFSKHPVQGCCCWFLAAPYQS